MGLQRVRHDRVTERARTQLSFTPDLSSALVASETGFSLDSPQPLHEGGRSVITIHTLQMRKLKLKMLNDFP